MIKLNNLMMLYKEERARAKHPYLVPLLVAVLWLILGVMLQIFMSSKVIPFLSTHYHLTSADGKTMVSDIFTTGLTIVIVVCVLRFVGRHSFKSMGFVRPLAKNYLLGIAMGIGVFAVCTLIIVLFGDNSLSFHGVSILPWLAFAGFFVVQGLSEEVLFRVFLFPEISAKFGVIVGGLVSSILFGLFHAMNGGVSGLAIFNLVVFGAMMAVVYYYYQNAWIIGAMHGFWNFAEGNIFGVHISGAPIMKETLFSSTVSGSNLLTGGDFGFEGGIICPIVWIAFSLLIVYINCNKKVEAK